MKTLRKGSHTPRGRKPAHESRATEFRRKLIEWKQTPESSRPSLRALARELGTSHQLLTFYLERPRNMARRAILASGERDSRSRICRGPAPNRMGGPASPCLRSSGRPGRGRLHVARRYRAYEEGVRTPSAVLAGDQSAEDLCQALSRSTGASAEVLARQCEKPRE